MTELKALLENVREMRALLENLVDTDSVDHEEVADLQMEAATLLNKINEHTEPEVDQDDLQDQIMEYVQEQGGTVKPPAITRHFKLFAPYIVMRAVGSLYDSGHLVLNESTLTCTIGSRYEARARPSDD